jgi:hypothetical protein
VPRTHATGESVPSSGARFPRAGDGLRFLLLENLSPMDIAVDLAYAVMVLSALGTCAEIARRWWRGRESDWGEVLEGVLRSSSVAADLEPDRLAARPPHDSPGASEGIDELEASASLVVERTPAPGDVASVEIGDLDADEIRLVRRLDHDVGARMKD